MRAFALHVCAGFALIGLAITLPAQAAQAAGKLGVVLIHGKQGNPSQLGNIVAALTHAGYLVDRPEMCWSHRRIYDRAYPDCLAEIDRAVERLRKDGATEIVVAGQSLGGNAAIGYGARHPDIKGVIAFAPAHAPEFIAKRPEVAADIARAKALIAKGEGDRRTTFSDANTGGKGSFAIKVSATPRVYLSFYGAESPAVMPANAARLKMPILLVSGSHDPTQRQAPFTFRHAPENPLNRFVKVDSNHPGTPEAGKAAMLAWLKELTK
jgi:pimeloyl-ACP methyl ester carboxylesterase